MPIGIDGLFIFFFFCLILTSKYFSFITNELKIYNIEGKNIFSFEKDENLLYKGIDYETIHLTTD